MALDNDRFMGLIAGRGLPEEDHIVQLVLDIAKVVFLSKVHQVIADGLCVLSAMGNGTDFFKITQYRLGLQAGKLSRIHLHTPPFICIYFSIRSQKSKYPQNW